MQTIKLFCLPYAGGSATIFTRWKSFINARIELIPVELAGRGKRIQERFYANLPEALNDLYKTIDAEVGNGPFALFGHSLGGLLVYELGQKFKDMKRQQPIHLFFSGRGAPSVSRDEKNYHLLDSDDFREKVIELGGTPPEFFKHPELMELFLPMLRNDFKLAETNLKQETIRPFDYDISVFMGKEDHEISAEQAIGWSAHTNGTCALYYINGDHFFLHNHAATICEVINHTLTGQVILESNSVSEKPKLSKV